MTQPDGHGMDQHHSQIDIKTYEDERVRMAKLSELYLNIHSGEYSSARPEVFRTPGTFLLEFAMGLLSEKQILEMVTSHPEAVCSSECIDERVKHSRPHGKSILSSHDGCGAAGVVAGLILETSESYDSDAYERLLAFLGEDEMKVLIDSLVGGSSSDLVGKVWSKALVAKANDHAQRHSKSISFEHAHLAIDHDHHCASMTIVDTAGEFMAQTPGDPGERPFVISNPEHLNLNNKEQSFKIMAQWAVLSLAIAWGSHSEIRDQTDLEYQVVVVISPETELEDRKMFNRYYQAAYKAKKTSFGDHKANVTFVTAQELSKSR